jgi:hypothetical protein
LTFPSRQRSRHSRVAGHRPAIPSAGGFEAADRQSCFYPDLFLRTAAVVYDKSEAAVGIPHFQFARAHPIFLFQPDLDQAADGFTLFLYRRCNRA